jgi:hypothetical protein
MMPMSVADYLKQIPAARRARFDQLMALIQEAYPDVLIDMHYRITSACTRAAQKISLISNVIIRAFNVARVASISRIPMHCLWTI